MLAPRRVIMASVLVLGCAGNAVTGVSDVKWSKQLPGSNIVYGSVAAGDSTVSADVPVAHVRACVTGVIKGLSQQEAAEARAARRLAPMTETITREMVRLLRDTGSTFLSVEKTVYRFAVANTRPYTFNCRTPFGTATFTLPARWSMPGEEGL
jgi:hypothetical protein